MIHSMPPNHPSIREGRKILETICRGGSENFDFRGLTKVHISSVTSAQVTSVV